MKRRAYKIHEMHGAIRTYIFSPHHLHTWFTFQLLLIVYWQLLSVLSNPFLFILVRFSPSTTFTTPTTMRRLAVRSCLSVTLVFEVWLEDFYKCRISPVVWSLRPRCDLNLRLCTACAIYQLSCESTPSRVRTCQLKTNGYRPKLHKHIASTFFCFEVIQHIHSLFDRLLLLGSKRLDNHPLVTSMAEFQ